MILPPDFEARTVEEVRRFVDDIPECAAAEISVTWQGRAPSLRFAFGDPRQRCRPILVVNLVAESKKNPLAPGRLVQGDVLRRVVREWVETYLKLQGPYNSEKVKNNASL